MDQKLSDWASVAEIISGIAVVATLIFLVVGIRENTAVTRAAVWDGSIDGVIQQRSLIMQNPELSRLFQLYQDGEMHTLSEDDHLEARFLVFNLFNTFEKAYFSNAYGVIGDSEWERFDSQICNQMSSVDQNPGLFERIDGVLTREFSEYIRSTCTGGQSLIE